MQLAKMWQATCDVTVVATSTSKSVKVNYSTSRVYNVGGSYILKFGHMMIDY